MPELVLAPIVAPLLGGLFTGLEGVIGAAIPGVLGGALATGVEGALTGAAIGAGEAALTKGNILKGAEGGAITGGVAPLLGGVLGDAGITGKLGGALSGAGADALGAAATGGNVGKAALMGAAGGALTANNQPGSIPISGPGATIASTTPGALPGGLTAGAGASSLGGVTRSNLAPLPGSDVNPNYNTGGGGSPLGGASPGTQSTTAAPAAAANPPSVASATAASTDSGGLGGILGGVEKTLGGLSPAQILAGGGLALDLSKGNQMPPGYDQMKTQADNAAAQAAQLQSYVNSGQLPSGLKAGLDAAGADAQAAIRAEYAARGMSGSSAEMQDLERANQSVVSKGADMAIQLFHEGIAESQLSTELYNSIMQESIAQDNQMADAIAKMSAAFAQMATPVSPGATAGA